MHSETQTLAIKQLLRYANLALIATLLYIISATPVSILIKLLNGTAPSWLGGIWYLGGLCGLILALSIPTRFVQALPSAWPYILINIWIILSFTWSSSPTDTLKGAMLFSLSQIGAIAFAVRFNWFQIIRFFAILMTSLIAVSDFLAIAVPSIGRMQEIYPGAWSGLWAEKQGLGFASVVQIIFVAIYALYYPNRLRWLFAILLGLAAIIGTGGKTALIMVIVAFAMIIGSKLMQRDKRLMLGTIWLGVVSVSLVFIIFNAYPDLIFKLTGKSSDLTGRKEIWEGIDFLVNMRPLTGWGYNVIWNGMQDPVAPYQWIALIADFTPFNAHSSFKEALLSIGQVGLVLEMFCVGWIILMSIITLRSNKIGSSLGLAAIASMLTIAATESIFIGFMDLYWFIIVMLGTKLALPSHVVAKIDPEPEFSQSDAIKEKSQEFFTYELPKS